ncbi:MAG: glycosyltransferase family 39 protein [Anaerolineales bacterium]|nr:glycosyltransferase family 39 protein [Anaerolineales bacterium]
MTANTLSLLALAGLVAIILDLALIRVWRVQRMHGVSGLKGVGGLAYAKSVGYWSVFFVPIILAFLPAWFVFFDRWQGSPLQVNFVFQAWHGWRFNQVFGYPYYFFVIFGCGVGLVGLGFLQREIFAAFLDETVLRPWGERLGEPEPLGRFHVWVRIGLWGGCLLLFAHAILTLALTERLPGLEYLIGMGVFAGILFVREFSIAFVLQKMRENADRWGSMLLAHCAWVTFLAGLYAGMPPLWVGLGAILFTHLNLVRHRKNLSPVYWLVTLALVLYTLGLNAWWFSVIGDEYEFFRGADRLAFRFSEYQGALFNGQYVYEKFTFFSSYLQAIFLLIFGKSNFGWRFSSLYLSAVSLVFFHDFFRRFLTRRVAVGAVALLAVSHYLMTFGKIGYNNLQALFALGLVLWASGWAWQSNRLLAYGLVGFAQGVCFYVFPAALYAVPLPFLLFVVFRPARQQRFLRWTMMGVSLFLTIFPLLLQPEYWATKMGGTLLNQPHLFASVPSFFKYVVENLVYALFAPLYMVSERHFVAVGLMDFLTAGFVIWGLGFGVWAFRHHPFMKFFILAFGYMLWMVGTTHGDAFPPMTRMFMLLPFWAVFATVGLLWLGAWLKQYGLPPPQWPWVYLTLWVTILGVNLFQAFPLSFAHMHRYHSFQVYFVRTAQLIWPEKVEQADPPSSVTLLFIFAQTGWLNTLQELIAVYQIPVHQGQWLYTNVPSELNALPPEGETLLLFPPASDANRPLYSPLTLKTLGWTACPIFNAEGILIFDLWYSPAAAWVCESLHHSPFESFQFGTLPGKVSLPAQKTSKAFHHNSLTP